MKVVLFDLGRTLEYQDRLLPGAAEMLAVVQNLQDTEGQPVVLGLVSDFDMPQIPTDSVAIRQRYYAILDGLNIRHFFEPVDSRVTLSTDLGVYKPDERLFRNALDKLRSGISFGAAMFVTEHPGHVTAARALGMRAVHFKGPGQTNGEITQLRDLIPIVRDFVSSRFVATAVSVGHLSAAIAIAPVPGISWARFGDEVFLFGKGIGWNDTPGRVECRALREQPGELPRDHIHLVIQKGRLFQKEHPDVSVLLDRGRFLVVAIDPVRVAWVGRHRDPCYTVRPLDDQYVAFDTRARKADRAAEVPWVRASLNGVGREEYQADLVKLSSHPTRFSTSVGYAEAATWVSRTLVEIGYKVETQAINIGGTSSLNVLANRPGTGPEPRGVIIVTAHLDSVNHEGGESAPAPGADDNASGSAGLLQIARTFRDHPNVDDLRFIFFGGEEQGLFGSRHYVQGLNDVERGRVRAVVNMDMIGCKNRSPSSVLIEGSVVSQSVIEGLADAAETYTGLTVETSLNPFASDHVPFIESGLPAVLTIEGADQSNPNIHTGSDLISNINFDIAMEILRMNVGFVALAVGRVDAAPPL